MGKGKMVNGQIDEEEGKPSFFIGDDKEPAPIKLVGPDEKEIDADEIIIAPDGGWGWVVVLASFLSNVIVDGIIFSFGLMSEPLLASFQETGVTDVSLSSIAWVGSLQSGFYLLGGPFVSTLANKYGFRMVAILGSFVAAVGFLASYVFCRTTPSLSVLFIFYGLVTGIGFNLLYVPSVIAVGFYFEKKRALATGIAICGSGVGTFIFAPLTYFLIKNLGWKITMIVQAGLVLTCSVCGAMYRPILPTKVSGAEKKEGDKTEQDKKLITPFPSPEGTPLLMRIKRAREMEKWDSINSVENEQQTDLENITQARKASTQSLTGPLLVHKQVKRMSVPSLLMVGEVPIVRTNTQISMRNKGNVGDLKEIEEENEVNEGDDGSGPKGREASNSKDSGNTNIAPLTSSLIISQKIGNSTYLVDEMTKSRILRVSSKSIINKPLYRDDIFYSGSMKRIPEYLENVQSGTFSSREWSAVISTKPSQIIDGSSLVDGVHRATVTSKSETKGCCQFFKKFNVLRKMLDFSLLASPSFVLLSVGGGITMLAFFVPFMFLKGIAVQNGVDESDAPLLISVIGIANTIGRIICGWAADRPEVNAVVINNVALTIGGLVNIAAPFFKSYWLFILYSVTFGLSIACYASLRSILVVELLGLSKLTNAFGLLCLFQGIAAMCGSPLAGFLYDTTGNFDLTFYVAGGLMLFSGIICYPLECVNRREKIKTRTEN